MWKGGPLKGIARPGRKKIVCRHSKIFFWEDKSPMGEAGDRIFGSGRGVSIDKADGPGKGGEEAPLLTDVVVVER